MSDSGLIYAILIRRSSPLIPTILILELFTEPSACQAQIAISINFVPAPVFSRSGHPQTEQQRSKKKVSHFGISDLKKDGIIAIYADYGSLPERVEPFQ